jgi:hypothetical protein
MNCITFRVFTVFLLHAKLWYDMIYLLTAIGLTPGGSSTVHIYTQTIHRTTQLKQKNTINNKSNIINNLIGKSAWKNLCQARKNLSHAIPEQLQNQHITRVLLYMTKSFRTSWEWYFLLPAASQILSAHTKGWLSWMYLNIHHRSL